NRAGENETRRVGEGAAGVHQHPCAVEIDREAEVEVGLGRAADHAGEVEHDVNFGGDQRTGEFGICDIAGNGLDARIGDQRGGGVADDDAVEALFRSAAYRNRLAAQKLLDHVHADKAGGAGNQDGGA